MIPPIQSQSHRRRRLNLLAWAAVNLLAVALTRPQAPLFAQAYPTQKRVPPPGIQIPESDRKELESGAAELKARIEKLTSAPAVVPDIEIFHKAVDWALRFDEFYDAKQVATAKALLAEGNARAKAAESRSMPWLRADDKSHATGLIVRGYRSRIDGSVQPYGMVIPSSWKDINDHRARPLYIWNHGRGDKMTEMAFINDRMKNKGEFAPEDAFVVHTYGRFCNATKFAGETDVFEVLDAVKRDYPIDEKRIVMTGFSMGGASVWHLAAHHAGLWAAATPGAGFAETPVYTKAFTGEKEAPPWWEQSLWHLYNATDYAANLANCPLIAYSGEIDPQKQSADIMEKAAAAEGIKLERIIGPNTGHKYEPGAKKELDRRLAELAGKGREEVPAKVRLVTYTLRYNRQAWVNVDALEKHWERADVTAEIAPGNSIKATTRNVAGITFEIQGKTASLNSAQPVHVTLDGQEMSTPAFSTPWSVSFSKEAGKWVSAKSVENAATMKRHGLQGPIDDAFVDSFIFVRPTGTPLNTLAGAWAKNELERAISQWRTVFRGDARVVEDTAVTPAMISQSNLVLWGDPSSNRLLRQVLPRLPIRWDEHSVKLGTEQYPSSTTVPVLIYPNPLNPKKYIVLNSSFTFRQGSNASNATQTPKLPDWALVDLQTPANDSAPGLIIDAGFFNEHWQP